MSRHRHITIKHDQQLIAAHAYHADNFWNRLLGLFKYGPLKTKQALILSPCSSIHSFGLTYSIDVIFLDKQKCIVSLHAHVKPWRIIHAQSKAHYAIELPANTLTHLQLKPGNKLNF